MIQPRLSCVSLHGRVLIWILTVTSHCANTQCHNVQKESMQYFNCLGSIWTEIFKWTSLVFSSWVFHFENVSFHSFNMKLETFQRRPKGLSQAITIFRRTSHIFILSNANSFIHNPAKNIFPQKIFSRKKIFSCKKVIPEKDNPANKIIPQKNKFCQKIILILPS